MIRKLNLDLISPLGTFTGTIIPDTPGVSQALQSLETAIDIRTSVSVKEKGAKGDGTTNDTAAFISTWQAADNGDGIYVPDGTYMVDYIPNINKQVHWRLDPGAVIKQRVPFNPNATLDDNWGIFQFVSGSQGSSVIGGTLDGNRASLAPYYKGHTRLGKDNHWWGIRTEFVDDFLLKDVLIRNTMNEGFYFFGGDRVRALNTKIRDCGVAFNAQGNNEYSPGWVLDVYAENIGNVVDGVSYHFFQHGAIAHQLDGPDINVRMKNFYGSKNVTPTPTTDTNTGGGKEPVPLAVSFYKLKRCKIKTYVNGYSGDGTAVGVDLNAITGFDISCTTFDIEAGIVANTLQDGELLIDHDGNWRYDSGFPRPGFLGTYGGVYDIVGAGLSGETTAANTTNGVTVRGRVKRSGIGVTDRGSKMTYNPGFDASGNLTDGIQLLGSDGTSNPYPLDRKRPNGGRTLMGVVSKYNGQCGVVYLRGNRDRIISSDIRDNGQQTGSRIAPYNIWLNADVGQGKYLSIVNNDLDISDKVIDTNGVTYRPGTAWSAPSNVKYDVNTSLGFLFKFFLRNPGNFAIGQFVKLNSVLAGPADATGKIVELDGDVATIAFASALQFVDTYVLDTLSGTVSTSGTTLTGTGTSFSTEVDYAVYLKSGSEHRRIVYLTPGSANTAGTISDPFTTNLNNAPIQVIRADIETGVYKPSRGYLVNENMTGPFLIRGNRTKNIQNEIDYRSFPALEASSQFELDFSFAMTGSTLDNTLVLGLPIYCQVTSTRVTFDTAITGLTGSVSLAIKDSGSTINTPVSTWTGFGIGVQHYGPSPEAPAFKTGAGSVNFVSGSGLPTGTITVRLTMTKFV